MDMKLDDVGTNSPIETWIQRYPASAAIFNEFSLAGTNGESLEHACGRAQVNLGVVCAKLRVLINHLEEAPDSHSEVVRQSLGKWIDRSAPGWLSRHPADSVDPIEMASRIHGLGEGVVEWLELSDTERNETFMLQSLSACLFNTYVREVVDASGNTATTHIGLLQLPWPNRSDSIQCCLAELQQLLVAPLAVFKAVRLPFHREDFPTAAEIKQADCVLQSLRGRLRVVLVRLEVAIEDFIAGR